MDTEFEKYLDADLARRVKEYDEIFSMAGSKKMNEISFNYCDQKHEGGAKERDDYVSKLVEGINIECHATTEHKYHWLEITIHRGAKLSEKG